MSATTRARWDAILFDLDGTLIDSIPLILDSFRHTFAACGLPVPAADDLLRGVGTPLRPHFAHYTADAALVERLVATYRQYNLANHDACVRPFPGVEEMLAAVTAAGTRLAIVTSKNRTTTERGLRVAGLADRVEVIVAADEVSRPKPHPEPVERALALLGVDRRRVVFVGDSLHDLHSGRGAGVRTAAALWGPFTRAELAAGDPDYWLETPGALCRVLGVTGQP
jgi:pyrophosphatase PpaX